LQSGNSGREHDEMLERESKVTDSESKSCAGVEPARRPTSKELVEKLAGK